MAYSKHFVRFLFYSFSFKALSVASGLPLGWPLSLWSPLPLSSLPSSAPAAAAPLGRSFPDTAAEQPGYLCEKEKKRKKKGKEQSKAYNHPKQDSGLQPRVPLRKRQENKHLCYKFSIEDAFSPSESPLMLPAATACAGSQAAKAVKRHVRDM